MRVADMTRRWTFHILEQEFLNDPNAFIFSHVGLPGYDSAIGDYSAAIKLIPKE